MEVRSIKDSISVVKEIFYLIGMIVALVLAYSSLDKRITLLETTSVTTEQLRSILKQEFKELKDQLKTEGVNNAIGN